MNVVQRSMDYLLPSILKPDLVNMAMIDGTQSTANIYYTAFYNDISVNELQSPGVLIHPSSSDISCSLSSNGIITLTTDCRNISVDMSTTEKGRVNITFSSSSLSLLSTTAAIHVWTPIEVCYI